MTKWTAYAHSITGDDYTSLVKQLGKPSLHYDGKNYVKATFSEDGVYQGGDTAGNNKGDTLYVVGERPGNRHPHQPRKTRPTPCRRPSTNLSRSSVTPTGR